MIQYIRKVTDGDTGEFVHSCGQYSVYSFKVAGLKAVPRPLTEDTDFYEPVDEKTHKQTKTEVVVAKREVNEANPKEIVAKDSKKLDQERKLTELKPKLREKLNSLDEKALAKVAKSVDVDPKKYDHLKNSGLKKMSTINSIVGVVTKKFNNGELNVTTALKLVAGV